MKQVITNFLLALILLAGSKACAQATILWEIRKEGSPHVSYLMGTMHQMGNSFTDSLPGLKAKLLAADLAVFESVGRSEQVANLINQRVPSGDIEHAFSKKEFAALKAISAGWKADLYKLHPIEVMVKLQQEFYEQQCGNVLPTDEWKHLDNYLIHLANTNHVPVYPLETDSQQAAIINGFEDNNWPAFKKVIVKWVHYHQHPERAGNACQDARNYRAFHLDYLFTTACENDRLLQQRNEAWMNVLPDLLTTKNCFIAVGLYHLYRSCGLIELLRKMGYTVTEAPMN